MKTAVLTAALAAIMITTLTATGCGGGGGSSNSTSTAPSLYTQSGEATLYAPLLGIYNAVWSEVGNSNTSGAAQLEFQSAVDPTAPGYNYNVIEVAVLGSGMPPGQGLGANGYASFADGGGVTLNSPGTAITGLNFYYPSSITNGGNSITFYEYYLRLTVSSPTTLTGTVTTGAGASTVTYNITLSKTG
jgi:hypothetical protein